MVMNETYFINPIWKGANFFNVFCQKEKRRIRRSAHISFQEESLKRGYFAGA